MGNTSLEAIVVYKALKTAIQEPMIGFEEPGARENVSYESITTIRIQSYFQ